MEAILKKDIDMIEKVQKELQGLWSKTEVRIDYEDRLRMLGLTTLETRGLRGDLI